MLLSAVIVALSALLAPDLFRRNRSGSLPVVLAEIAVSAGTGASLLIISGIGVNILPNCRTSRRLVKFLPSPERGFLASRLSAVRVSLSSRFAQTFSLRGACSLLSLRTTVSVDILPRLLQTAVCRVCLKFSVFWLRLPRLLRTLGRYILPGRLLRALGLLLYRKPVAGPFSSLCARDGSADGAPPGSGQICLPAFRSGCRPVSPPGLPDGHSCVPPPGGGIWAACCTGH